jgi:GNAT superfamily N-acetyltransferase
VHKVTIRQATAADLEQLIPLCIDYCIADQHTVDESLIRVGVNGLLASADRGFVLVACDEVGKLIGYAAVSAGWSIEIGGPDFVLDELFVRDQGQGIGSDLVAAVETHCRSLGVKRIFLETERPNDRARLLYARLGFAQDDSIWMSKDL